MKALGIVRKIDELGRVVIPKEIRRVHGWEEGESMEFFVDGNRLVIQPYMGERDRQTALDSLQKLRSGLQGTQQQEIDSVINFLSGKDGE